MSTNNELLILAGVALYGPRWTADLARELGMSDRHMRRLAAGTAEVAPGVMSDLQVLVLKREKALHEISVQLSYAWHQSRLDA